MNLQHLGDGTRFLPTVDELAGKGNLLGRQGRGAAEPDALRHRGGTAATGALMDQGSLELRDAGEDRQHHAAGRRRSVGPRLGEGPQAGLGRIQPFGDVEKIARRPGEAVKPGDRHHVTRPQHFEHPRKLGPVTPGAGCLFFIDALASCRLQRRALLVQGLVVGRDAGISDEQGGLGSCGRARNLPRAIRRGNPYSAAELNSNAKPRKNSGFSRQAAVISILRQQMEQNRLD